MVEEKKEHYTSNARMADNVGKDSVFNVIPKKDLNPYFAKIFFSCEATGVMPYSNFVDERLFGEVSVWEPVKEKKLPTFNIHVKSCNVNTKEGVVNIKKERKLMSSFIVASRARQNIDLPFYIGG